MSLENAIKTQHGEFIKDLEANVSEAKAIQSKAGKTFFKCKLTDGAFTAFATSFSQTFEHVNGQRVRFSGMGIKRGDDYNGTAQVTIGDKTKWEPLGGAQPSAPVQQTAPQAPQPAQHAAPSVVEGVTVGMALNKAVDIAVFTGDPSEQAIWEYASMLIRLSGKLKAGEMAPAKEGQ